jgi:putative transposase
VEIAGVTREADGVWMNQMARNLSDAAEGFLIGKRYLIHDRDPLFTEEFLKTLEATGIESVKLPPSSPNLNAHAQRFVRTIKEILLGSANSLRRGLVAKGDP